MIKLLDCLLPTKKYPVIAFFGLVIFFFVLSDVVLDVVQDFSSYTHMSHLFIGIIILAMFMSSIEVINLSIAAKNNEMQLGMTSIFSSIVLQFLLLIPLAINFKMFHMSSTRVYILSRNHHSEYMFLPLLAIVVITGTVFIAAKMKISKVGQIILFSSYLAFAAFQLAVHFTPQMG